MLKRVFVYRKIFGRLYILFSALPDLKKKVSNLFCFAFEIGSHYIALEGLEFTTSVCPGLKV